MTTPSQRVLLMKDLEIIDLSRRLEETVKKLWVYENLERAVVPEVMGFKEYIEGLEGRIEAFREFLVRDRNIMLSDFTKHHGKCRFCCHIYDYSNDPLVGLVDPGLHYPKCPLKKALAK